MQAKVSVIGHSLELATSSWMFDDVVTVSVLQQKVCVSISSSDDVDDDD